MPDLLDADPGGIVGARGSVRPLTPPPSVFVVDDEPSVQTALVRLLASAGYKARGFLSARAFLADTAIAPAA